MDFDIIVFYQEDEASSKKNRWLKIAISTSILMIGKQ